MKLDDFVMLGRTEPAESKKHGACVCSAGYSRELGQLVRIYPLPVQSSITAWMKCSVPLRRPRDDNRVESWRIDAETDDTFRAEQAVTMLGKADKSIEFDFLSSIAADSIDDLNKRRSSLGIVRPSSMRWHFDRRENVDPDEQMTLFDRLETGGTLHKSDLIPRIEFYDEKGGHNLSLKEWGCARWLAKERNRPHVLWDNLRLTDPDYEHLLLVGNQKNRRNSWLIIKTIFRRKVTQQDLFSEAA